ncbi:MAG: hypothetical protein ACI9J3_000269 [Parvicellaceae bacterium]|jgi:hypothetical protein
MVGTEITLETVSESNLAGLVALSRKVFNKKRSEDYFRQKYLKNTILAQPVSSVALVKGQEVAFVGAIPQLYKGSDQTHLIAHTCEYQTHPDYRNLQIHSQLIDRTNKILRAQGVNMLYAYFSDVSERSVKRLGWNHLRYLHFTVIQTGAIPIQKAKYKILGKSGWESFIVGLKQLSEITTNDSTVLEVINSDLLKYRTFTDNGIFDFSGCAFWIKLSEVLHIGKFSTENFDSFKSGLTELIKRCKKFGIDKIVFQTDPDGLEYEFLKRCNYNLEPGALIGTHFLNEEFNTDKFEFSYSSFDNF